MTGLSNFDNTVQQTNELLDKVESTFGWQDRREQSYSLLRSTLQALRDRLPVHQAVHLSSELPMLVRGFYFEGWDPEKVPLKYNKSQFLEHVRQKFPYSDEREIEELVSKTLSLIMKQVSNGTHQQIKEMLPEEIAELLK